MTLRWITAGESHGPGIVSIVEGLPAGLPLTAAEINHELARRQQGFGRGGRMRIEHDEATLLSGVRHGRTLGSPLTLLVNNRDWSHWQRAMASEAVEAGPDENWRMEPVTRPRPGHTDLAGGLKYDHSDLRNVLERSSARETAARVAAGAAAKALLRAFGIAVDAWVVQIGAVAVPEEQEQADGRSAAERAAAAEASPVRCPYDDKSAAMVDAIRTAGKAGDTLGGVFQVTASGVPAGLGSHAQYDRRLDGLLAQALMGVNAIKGVEIGLGFAAAGRPGSQVHDAIYHTEAVGSAAGSPPPLPEHGPVGSPPPLPEHGPAGGYYRASNGAGGIEGGISNGAPIVLRAAMKPIATLAHALPSVDIRSHEPFRAHYERSDVCAVPAAAVIGEAVVALELARAFLEKFGGDSLVEVTRNYRGYLDQMRSFGRGPDAGPRS